MIKDSELSKGNNVLFGGMVAEILELREKYARIKYTLPGMNIEHYLLVEYERLDPIVITEDVLLKCGFEETHKSSYRQRFDHVKNPENGYDFSFVENGHESGFRYYGHRLDIKHLHRLQNLHFELNDEKLVYRY
jgi:hypothetical protein